MADEPAPQRNRSAGSVTGESVLAKEDWKIFEKEVFGKRGVRCFSLIFYERMIQVKL